MLSQRNHFDRSSENLLDQGQLVQLIKTRLRECGENSFILNTELDEPIGCWGIIFLTKYRPELFSDITGVIALNNINILSAEIRACWEESLAEIFMVTRVSSSNHPDEIWKQMKSDLENTFTGKLALTYRLNLNVLHPIPSNLSKYSYGQNVVVDNKISDSFTLIQVFTQDKLGLLYKITHTLTDLRLAIRTARISTKNNQVADEFYVHDLTGKKVEEKEQIEEIKRAILHQIS